MTRTHKQNDRDHAGLADGTAQPAENIPRFFGKSGFADADPKKVKKEGGGRGNWYVLPRTSHELVFESYRTLCHLSSPTD